MQIKRMVWFYFFMSILILTGGCKQNQEFTVENSSKITTEDSNKKETSQKETKKIYIYVCGYVKKPGVYEVKEDARIYDALLMAGGVCEEGNGEVLNQAESMVDGQTIYVPSKFESQDPSKDDGRININLASKEEMMTLPGIGESKADLIIKYREQNGDFKKEENLMDIPGIKQGVFDKIKEKIKVK